MPIFSIVFLCGDIFLQQFKMLPSLAWLIIPALALCIYLYKKYKIIYIFLIFLLGFSYSLLFSYERKASILPNNIEGKTIPIEGYIFSIPQTNEIQTQFHFTFYKMNHIKKHGMIQLSWRDQKNHLVAGNHWKLFVRLKRIHGMMNPGGSDYEAWALQEGIIAQGYVVNHVENSIINHSWVNAPVTHVRQLLKECIDEVLLKTPTSPWIYALALGERHDIPPEDWEVLRKTGTNHLMAIAGLHIGFMSGFIFAIVSFIWRRFYYLSIIIPAQYAGAIAALLMTLTYSALAGFSIPTQRACIMLLVFLIYLLLRRKIAAWSAWSAALFLVLLFNPLSVLSESFWLSFGSVALIIYGVSGRLHPTGLWWKWGRIQWVMALGLVPLSIALFGQCSLISFVANSLAIPWVGFIIVPLVLLGCFTLLFSMKLGGFFLFLADKNLTWMWSILSYFSHFSGSVWYQFIPHYWIIIMAITGVVILLLPIGFPGRWLGVIGLLPMLYYKPVPVHFSEVKLTLLDVGQGLSVVIQTQKHLLVFDAGAHLSNSYDMGSSVVIPFLRTLSNKKIDMLVISHGDNDHAGGAETILKQITFVTLKTSVPEKFKHAEYCLQNKSWNWDGVEFKFLYPTIDTLHLGNDSSCVLKITAGNKSVLLTGDIEKFAEKELVKNDKFNLHADILVAPHHGSKTSADDSFLHATNPTYVLFPIGYRNRYHFPNKSVIEKYKIMQVTQLDTVNSGAIQIVMNGQQSKLEFLLYRTANRHYWNN